MSSGSLFIVKNGAVQPVDGAVPPDSNRAVAWLPAVFWSVATDPGAAVGGGAARSADAARSSGAGSRSRSGTTTLSGQGLTRAAPRTHVRVDRAHRSAAQISASHGER